MTKVQNEQRREAGHVGEDVQKKIEAAVDAQMQTAEVKAQAEAALEQQMQSAEVKAQAEAALEQQMQSDEVKAIIAKTTDEKAAELIEENYASEEVQSKIKEAAVSAKEGAYKIIDLEMRF